MNDIEEVLQRYLQKLWPSGMSFEAQAVGEKCFFAGAALMLQAVGHMQSKMEQGEWKSGAPVTLQVSMFTQEIDAHGTWDEVREVLKEWSEEK